MTAKLLEKHITDTIREWQVKIGYEGGTMKLYYPGGVPDAVPSL